MHYNVVQNAHNRVEDDTLLAIDLIKVDLAISCGAASSVRDYTYEVSPGLLKHANKEVIDCLTSSGTIWHRKCHGGIFIDNKAVEVENLIDGF